MYLFNSSYSQNMFNIFKFPLSYTGQIIVENTAWIHHPKGVSKTLLVSYFLYSIPFQFSLFTAIQIYTNTIQIVLIQWL